MSTQTRDKMVRDLTPAEAGALLVHCHSITPERRQALMLWAGPADAYFRKEEQHRILDWIKTEDYLPQDSRIADHPKRPTHWCDKHGHVVTCDCDSPEEKEHQEKLTAHIKQLGKQCRKRAEAKWGKAWRMLSHEQQQGTVALEACSVVLGATSSADVIEDKAALVAHIRGVINVALYPEDHL